MKKIILIVALITCSFGFGQIVEFKANVGLGFEAEVSDDFELKCLEDANNLIYSASFLPVTFIIGPNHMILDSEQLVNNCEWYNGDTTIYCTDFKDFQIKDKYLSFNTIGTDRHTGEKYIEYMYYDLNEEDESGHYFLISYWYTDDNKIEGQLVARSNLEYLNILRKAI